ncbi:RNA polymerase sigma factor [Xylanibacter oryzae]|uniref:RNA polymerase sigma factor n=1 Tax=Xylanibacter oryzae TaxID=185293 RepID=UPI0004B7D135|nr:RNA polymerase sigma factor [Xylanibacter oryzae]
MNISQQVFDDFKENNLDSLYREAWPSLMSYAARILGKKYAMMTEDCVQESILTVYHSLPTLVSPSQLKAFLFTCLHNKCVSVLRKGNTQNKYLNQLETIEPEVSTAIIEQETIDMLLNAINELPDKYRQIFELNFQQGLKNAEAAAMLDISIDNFNKRKSKMISLLRNRFGGDEFMQILISVLFSIDVFI